MAKVWDEPVIVGDHLIFTPHQAHQFLRSKKVDGSHSSAEGILAAVIDGRVSPEEARDIFLRAVRLA